MDVRYFIISLLIISSGCIDKVDINYELEDELFVVDGTLTDAFEEQFIRLSKSLPVNSQVFKGVEGASLIVESSTGEQIIYTEKEAGLYSAFAQAKQDMTYQLLGEMPNGTKFSSSIQTVIPSFPIDSISLVDTMIRFVNESGRNDRFQALQFTAHGRTQQLERDLNMRFQVETAYQVSEIQCGPFHNPKQCYFLNDQTPQDITLLSLESSQGETGYSTKVFNKEIDYTTGEIFALHLNLYSYNQDVFTYWQNIKSLFDQNGNITDKLPAKVVGNIASEEEEILGYFAVVGTTSKTLFVTSSDYPTFQFPYCGLPELRPFPLPNECCDCLNFENANIEKPSFWF